MRSKIVGLSVIAKNAMTRTARKMIVINPRRNVAAKLSDLPAEVIAPIIRLITKTTVMLKNTLNKIIINGFKNDVKKDKCQVASLMPYKDKINI